MGTARVRNSRCPTERRYGIRFVAWSAVTVVLAVGAVGWLFCSPLSGTHASTDIDAVLGSDRPRRTVPGALNVLLLGSDARGAGGADARMSRCSCTWPEGARGPWSSAFRGTH
ncbi:hypothetical protein [Streptomyces spirodelae]|uniref:hypothetical protein n=1 Tax=Streptomyces spirodelae TaxID=2812904 RepID=UPI001E3DD3AE|nr:hypothetical protein [Streptomyces spirodelae]